SAVPRRGDGQGRMACGHPCTASTQVVLGSDRLTTSAATATEANAPEGGSPVTTDRPAPQGPPHRPVALAAVQHCTGRDPDPQPPGAPAEAAARAGPSELA